MILIKKMLSLKKMIKKNYKQLVINHVKEYSEASLLYCGLGFLLLKNFFYHFNNNFEALICTFLFIGCVLASLIITFINIYYRRGDLK